MRKFLAVVRHEYRKIVVKWAFLIGTLLFPVLAAALAVVPAIIFSIEGAPTRIVIVDPSGKIAPRIKENLEPAKMSEKARQAARESLRDLTPSQEEKMRRTAEQVVTGFVFVDYGAPAVPAEQIKRELMAKVVAGEIDAYLLIPPDTASQTAKFEYFSRKAGDFVVNQMLEEAVNDAVRSQRLAEANIDETRMKEFNRRVDFATRKVDEKGEKDSDSVLAAAFAIGLMIYITLAIYGQQILGAVVEEKETRIAEILFSSARPFELMMGKLVGVGLAALTQLGIWIISAAALISFGLTMYSAAGMGFELPTISPLMIIYFLIFFLLGFFLYASIFALIGAVVTTVQEGGQFSFPPIMLLLVGFYFTFAVVRDPNSDVSFWVSIAPFLAPITMPVRILAETPPFWQIALSMLLNGLTIAGLIWVASRVYRIGMLMYGKRATIPEIWKWIRQP